MNFKLISFICYFILNTFSWAGPWTGHSLRLGMGGALDLEIDLDPPKPHPKGDGHPSSAMLRYGYEYGYQFASGLYLSGELDWTITYPRNFHDKSKKYNFFQPPISLWYVPMTNVQVGYAFNDQWLITAGLVFYWAMSNSIRYRPPTIFFASSHQSYGWIEFLIRAALTAEVLITFT